LRAPELPTYSYSASKAGVHQLTRVLARELGPRHITVNAVAPGPFESKMMAVTLAEFGEEIAASSPLGRIGRPDDIAGVAIFWRSRAGAYVPGAIIPVAGGIWAAHCPWTSGTPATCSRRPRAAPTSTPRRPAWPAAGSRAPTTSSSTSGRPPA